MNKTYAVILAGGIGTRIESHLPKQLLKISGKTVLEHTIDAFEHHELIDDIILVVNPDYAAFYEDILVKSNYRKVSRILNGGSSRFMSSCIGVDAINDEDCFVLIHDAARPFINKEIISNVVRALTKYDSVDVAIPSPDTIIKIKDTTLIDNVPARKNYMLGQTPQGFQISVIKKAHELALKEKNLNFTDDCGIVNRYKLADTYVVQGDRFNIKITYPEDLYLADRIFQLRTSTGIKKELHPQGLKDKVIVVFGASRGIGKSIMDIASEYGAKTCGFSRKLNNVDISNYTIIEKKLRQCWLENGRIDYVVVSAAILKMGKLNSRDIDEIRNEIDINYLGSINVVKATIEYLKKTNGSILLFTSSSYTRGRQLYSVYSSTKAAIVNLVQALAEELRADGIRINAVCPERTSTPMRIENFGNEPVETLLKPESVAKVALNTLISDLTGQVVDCKKY
jgi:2-C-methyl-D-erythritol 4-phosphate cytidylyltransferase